MKLSTAARNILQVERACGDLRRGAPVIVTDGENNNIVIISPDNNRFINDLFGNDAVIDKKLIISSARAGYLFPQQKITMPVAINANNLTTHDIAEICASCPSDINLEFSDCTIATKIEQSALKLAKISELIPAIVIFSTNNIENDFIAIGAQDIDSYQENVNYNLQEVCRTKLTLVNAPNAQIIAYRPNIGGAEHYAIIIGAPGDEPLVRVHSSCYTGDLLSSLSCDCRDQLQSAINIMGASNGGIILYLMQEGRGIGMVNKLRAYNFKEQGMNTFQANQALGFDDDERLFLPAAEMLKKLGINKLRLLTNNSQKAAGLKEYGINVVSCVPHVMESNEHNEAYLRDKMKNNP